MIEMNRPFNEIEYKRLEAEVRNMINDADYPDGHSYFFNDEYGLYDTLKRSNLDALILASLDAKNDCFLDNLYENEYIQTILPHPSEELMKICKGLRLDKGFLERKN